MKSDILELPPEVRNEIYIWLFSSTRVLSGKRMTAQWKYATVKPAPNALAIIRTNRHIHNETKNLWLKHILIAFEEPLTMLDKLWSLPSTTLSQIRHLRVYSYTIEFQVDRDHKFESVSSTLHLLPDLSLDTLTIFCDYFSEGAWQAHVSLNKLVKRGAGWRTLRYIVPDRYKMGDPGGFLIELERKRPWHISRPGIITKILHDRDGDLLGARVAVYRSTESGSSGTVFDPKSRIAFTQEGLWKDGTIISGAVADDAILLADTQATEALFVIERGEGADIMARPRPPSEVSDEQWWADGKTWPKIRKDNLVQWPWSSGHECSGLAVCHCGQAAVIDSYDSVDDCVWYNHN